MVTVISTFAGGGGSSLGYKWAGFKELLAIEWDQNAVDTLKANFDFPVWQRDICEVTVEDILKFCKIKKGDLDVLDGSPPCQGFSTAGKRVVSDSRNDLFKEYVRLIEGLEPKVFVMENVSGMIKGTMKGKFNEILKTLKALNYNVKVKLMNAMWYEVPQSRERLFFIGVRNDLKIEPSFPKPRRDFISVSTALGIPASTGFLEYRHSYEKGKHKTGKSEFNKPCLTITRSQNFSVNRYGDQMVNIKKPIGTITRIGRWFLDDKNEFSLEAYKKLASYPDEFIFASFSHGKARIGNSVPPKMMYHIAKNIKENILEKENNTKQ